MLKTEYVKQSQESETLLIHELSRLKANKGEDIIRFGFGQSPFLPVPSALEELKNRVEHKEYVSVQGLEELRDAVAKFHNHYDQINVTSDNILIAPGSKILIYSIIASFNDADVFLVTPSWVSYEPQANLAKLPVTRIQTNFENRWRLLPSELERACEQRENKERPIVMVFNYPGNPDGLTYTQEELEALTVVFRKYNILVISDEIYGLLNHQGNHTSLARFYPEGTIVTSGLSKWCGAGGWRLGVALLPTSLDDKLKKTMIGIASETYSCASTPVQYAAIKAYQIGSEVENYLAHQRRILQLCGAYVWKTLSKAGVNVHLRVAFILRLILNHFAMC
jgi:aspartate aminotransferase